VPLEHGLKETIDWMRRVIPQASMDEAAR
jgi:hypothetical protein